MMTVVVSMLPVVVTTFLLLFVAGLADVVRRLLCVGVLFFPGLFVPALFRRFYFNHF